MTNISFAEFSIALADMAAAAPHMTPRLKIDLGANDLLARNHAISKLAPQMEMSDAAKAIDRRANHWCAARA
jgi:hypothetical protein